jgi:hypothetical protein
MSKKKKKSTVSKKQVTVKRKKAVRKPIKKVVVAKDVAITPEKKAKIEEKPGSSNVGKFEDVSPINFAGPSGGASPYSFPIDTLLRARNALSRAHFAPNPEGIKRAVYKKWPQLNPKTKKR